MKIIEKTIFGHNYNVFMESCCSPTDKRTLYIDLLNICNAKCSFCSAGCNINHFNKHITSLNFIKECVRELIQNRVIDKIALTGGEPLLYPDLKGLCDFLDSLIGNGLEFYSLTTNGIMLKNKKIFDIINNSKLSFLNISRHHYNDDINNSVFGIQSISTNELSEIVPLLIPSVRINCCATDYFCNSDDVRAMVDFCKTIGASKLLIRKEYNSTYENDTILQYFTECHGCKITYKCQCRYKTDNSGFNIEYRVVKVQPEQDVEENGSFIRNFVIKNTNILHGGWSEKSKVLFDILPPLKEWDS